jgi:uncharacterized protein UPF0093
MLRTVVGRVTPGNNNSRDRRLSALAPFAFLRADHPLRCRLLPLASLRCHAEFGPVWSGRRYSASWFHAKLLLVLILSAVHGFFFRWVRAFAADRNPHSQKFYRIINEVPTLLMIGIVVLVIVKPIGANRTSSASPPTRVHYIEPLDLGTALITVHKDSLNTVLYSARRPLPDGYLHRVVRPSSLLWQVPRDGCDRSGDRPGRPAPVAALPGCRPNPPSRSNFSACLATWRTSAR